ncbi:MAG: hypothetical protein ABIJ46_02435 [bacterium]
MTDPKRDPDWSDVKLVSVRVVGDCRRVFHIEGINYATPGELAVAQALTRQGISFVPDVSISWPRDDGQKPPNIYVPDFIFCGQALLWQGANGLELIHGLEIKGRNLKGNLP